MKVQWQQWCWWGANNKDDIVTDSSNQNDIMTDNAASMYIEGDNSTENIKNSNRNNHDSDSENAIRKRILEEFNVLQHQALLRYFIGNKLVCANDECLHERSSKNVGILWFVSRYPENNPTEIKDQQVIFKVNKNSVTVCCFVQFNNS